MLGHFDYFALKLCQQLGEPVCLKSWASPQLIPGLGVIINRVPPQFGLTDFDWVGSTLKKRNLLNKLVFASRFVMKEKDKFIQLVGIFTLGFDVSEIWPPALLAKLACISEGEHAFQCTFYKVSIQTSHYKIYPFGFPFEDTMGIKKQIRLGKRYCDWGNGLASVRMCQRPLLPLLQFCSLPPSVHFLQLIPWFSQKLILSC